jgi:Protein of unknown function (DUF2971)
MVDEKNAEVQDIPRMIHRVFDPTDTDIFYHYCSNETLRLICENKTLRFSDVNMLNDYAESRWGYMIFEDAASLLLRRESEKPMGFTRGFFDCVDPHLADFQHFKHGAVCSFSRSGDILSQWRAYADQGRGVCIGFGGKTLRNLDAWRLKVEYDPERQTVEFAHSLIDIFQSDDAEIFVERCRSAALLALGYKNPAFHEEREIRCVHMLDVKGEQGKPLLRSPDGHEVRFRTQGADIIAYVDLPISLKIDPQPIKRIIMGPKNPNKPGNLQYMLRAAGLGEPSEIVRSSASLV